MATKKTLTLAHPSEIPLLSQISQLAFSTDTHTLLKILCSNPPYNHASAMSSALNFWMAPERKRRVFVISAVSEDEEDEEDEEGEGKRKREIVGWAAWATVGFELGEDELLDTGLALTSENDEEEGDERKEDSKIDDVDAQGKKEQEQGQEQQQQPQNQKIAELEDLTNAAMTKHLPPSSPPGPPHILLLAINVHPLHQCLGIGSSLLSWGSTLADRKSVFTWVSSSDSGWGLFEKNGLRQVGRLSVELDDYAGDVKRGDGTEWGAYCWRYARREVGGKTGEEGNGGGEEEEGGNGGKGGVVNKSAFII